MNVGSDEVFRAGNALAGGVAMQGETCGALTGAIMAIGWLIGRRKIEDIDQYRKTNRVAIGVYNLFKERIGHTLCAEIHKIKYGRTYRLLIPEEYEAFHKAGGHSRTGCPEVCGIAARMAGEIILDIKEGR